MLFPTIDFAVFLAFVLIAATVARALGNTANKIFLVLASLAFYSFWSVGFAALMVGVAVLTWFTGRVNRLVPNRRLRIAMVAVAITIALGILAYFKYYNFAILLLFNSSVTQIFGLQLQFIEVVTPVAISFFTFHAISYIVDTYKNPSLSARSPIDVLLYISFFPHLVAGPIVRAATFIPQLAETPQRTALRYAEAMMLIFSGLWKKMIAANYLAVLIVEPVFTAPSLYGSADLALAAVAYAFQIYFDFSAYSSIAIGVAALLGYHFPENFDQPYRSLSVREFWRRWHITLSSWLRDYLYIPLGGSRRGAVRMALNLMITMVLGGLWHGANTTFLVWGTMHGLALVFVHFWSKTGPAQRVANALAYKVFAWALTFVFLLATWVVFRSPDFATAGQFFTGLFTNWAAPELASGLVLGLIALGFVGQFLPPTLRSSTAAWLAECAMPAQVGLATAGMVALLLIAPSDSAPFIYFQF